MLRALPSALDHPGLVAISIQPLSATYSLLFQTLLNPIIYVHFDLTINPFDLTINLLDLTINLHDLTINLKDLTINLFDLTINHLYIRGQNLGFVVIRSV